MSAKGCTKQYCNWRHAPQKKGTALVAVDNKGPKAKVKAKAKAKAGDADDRAATPAPGKKKLAQAKAAAKKPNALVATIEEQRKAAM